MRRRTQNPDYTPVLSLAKPWALILGIGLVGASLTVLSQNVGCFSPTALPKEPVLAMMQERVLGDAIEGQALQDVSEAWIENEFLQEPQQTNKNYTSHVSEVWIENEFLQESQQTNKTQTSHAIDSDPKALFPLESSDYWGFFFACVGLMVAAGGGIGGGGILVPIYILVMGFSPKHGIALSSITVLGGSVANTLLNSRKRHPLADRPLVDWDLILVMEPLTIAGTLIGAFLNKILPELLLTSMLVLLLSVTAWESFSKAIKMYRKETAELQKLSDSKPDPMLGAEVIRLITQEKKNYNATDTFCSDSDESTYVDDEFDTNSGSSDEEALELEQQQQQQQQQHPVPASPLPEPESHKTAVHEIDSVADDELAKILEEKRTVNKQDVLTLTVMLVVVLTVNILKGGGAFPSPLGIACGSVLFWLANLFMLLWILGVAAFVRQKLVRQWEQKRRVGFPYVEGDIQWCPSTTIIYPLVCCFAGFFAGMFGVGGGIVQGPLLLTMGVHPVVASATLAYLVLFTAFTATTSFAVFGLLLLDYAIVCFIIGFLATCVGQFGLSYIMKKAQRNSYIAFCIGTVVFVSSILMTIQSLLSIVKGAKHHSGGICGKGE